MSYLPTGTFLIRKLPVLSVDVPVENWRPRTVTVDIQEGRRKPGPKPYPECFEWAAQAVYRLKIHLIIGLSEFSSSFFT